MGVCAGIGVSARCVLAVSAVAEGPSPADPVAPPVAVSTAIARQRPTARAPQHGAGTGRPRLAWAARSASPLPGTPHHPTAAAGAAAASPWPPRWRERPAHRGRARCECGHTLIELCTSGRTRIRIGCQLQLLPLRRQAPAARKHLDHDLLLLPRRPGSGTGGPAPAAPAEHQQRPGRAPSAGPAGDRARVNGARPTSVAGSSGASRSRSR